jgi:hypothetical protein
MAHGSIPAGPSSLYLSLLKGKISAEDYAKQAKKRVHEDFRKPPAGSADAAQAST